MSKYHSKKVTVNGVTFDSKKEYIRFCQLSQLEKAGAITNLQRQVKFELIPAQYETVERYGKGGKRLKDGRKCVERAVCYLADFVFEIDGKTIVEDVKGVKTKEYILKRKLMLHVHGIKISEV
jgi:hypothetical protein